MATNLRLDIAGQLSSSTFRVKSSSAKGDHRNVTLLMPSGKELLTKLPRMALVGPEDIVYVDPRSSSRIAVCSSETPADLIPVTPHFERRHSLRLGDLEYQVVLREITGQEDLEQYEYLEGFHYKTSSAIVTDEEVEGGEDDRKAGDVGGRKAVLVAYVQQGRRFIPAGYIELQMPLLMVKPRHVLFSHGFAHPTRPVRWEKWDASSMKEYVNLIVRIARVVTSPDLRGLGLARQLILCAKEFARERWHIGGRRPLFMEISAEMLKYMDFTTSAGLHFVGNTEGNLSRIHRDLIQMQKGQKVSFGMMSLQKKYLTTLQALCEQYGKPFASVLERLKDLTAESDEDALRSRFNGLDPDEWYLFKKVLRFPIPYFMCGLDDASEAFVAAHAETPPARAQKHRKLTTPARIRLRDIRVASTYQVPDSVHARAVRDCFGLDGTRVRVTLLGPVSIEASGGNIILITGPSGSGKSVLLNMLDTTKRDPTLRVSFQDVCGRPFDVAWMVDIKSERPLIEYFAERWGMEQSISALNQAGLSEAFVYLRPYRLLSRGQQYRARLAALSLREEPVWLIDELCADLDPFTARVVASNLRRAVVRSGRILIAAAANNAHYVDALRPIQVIYLRHNGKAEVLSYKEYADEFCHRTA